jgi:hypothetical protein
MGSYRSDDEALIGLARQLTDAYGEARTREDQDYACDAIAQFLAEFRDAAPGEALLALLDLPLTAETYPLVDEAQAALARRGPAVVGLLLEAVLGEVYDQDGPAPERAAETIDSMPSHEVSLGLCDVLRSDADGQLKSAALDALAVLGGVAEPELVSMLDDPVAGEWATAALEQLRYIREYGDPLAESFEIPEDFVVEGEAARRAGTGDPDDESGDTAAEDPGSLTPPGETSSGPEKDVVDEAYDEFRRRFEQESGGESTSP